MSDSDDENNIAQATHALQEGRLGDAERLLSESAGSVRPSGDALHLMGVVSIAKNAPHEAIDFFQRAVQSSPTLAPAYYNLGKLLLEIGRTQEGVDATRQAVNLQPRWAAAWNNLGNGLTSLGCYADAIAAFNRSLEIEPSNGAFWSNSAKAHRLAGDIGAALQSCIRSTELDPSNPSGWLNLAAAHLSAGAPDDARDDAGHAASMASDPNDRSSSKARSLIAGLSNYLDDKAVSVAEAHKSWAVLHADPATPPSPKPHSPDPDRILKVGYVSPDFRRHSVAHFIAPLFDHHNSERIRVFALSDVAQSDDITARLRRSVDEWIDVTNADDEAVSQIVRERRIDLLVDLAGPTSGHRLGVFAKRPAPIQISWLGFPGSSGMRAMDWRIADELAAPTEEDYLYPDQVWRTSDGHHCFDPLGSARPESTDTDRQVTFGCFNHIAKISDGVLAAWSAILERSEGSLLRLKADGLDDPVVANRLSERLKRAGVPIERISLDGRIADQSEHMGRYDLIDVALDPFPYNGTATTCESLWMGVPVVSVRGHAPAGRVGASILASAGLQEFLVADVASYVDRAVQLAAPGPRTLRDRISLHEAVAHSSLCDGPSFADKIETAYREMWRDRLSRTN